MLKRTPRGGHIPLGNASSRRVARASGVRRSSRSFRREAPEKTLLETRPPSLNAGDSARKRRSRARREACEIPSHGARVRAKKIFEIRGFLGAGVRGRRARGNSISQALKAASPY